jgi:hypothetical protein
LPYIYLLFDLGKNPYYAQLLDTVCVCQSGMSRPFDLKEKYYKTKTVRPCLNLSIGMKNLTSTRPIKEMFIC